jgi:hypothetical protein
VDYYLLPGNDENCFGLRLAKRLKSLEKQEALLNPRRSDISEVA